MNEESGNVGEIEMRGWGGMRGSGNRMADVAREGKEG